MTGRERMLAAVRGGEVDKRPVLGYLGCGDCDAIAVPPADVASTIEAHAECAVLAIVPSPLGLALKEGTDIVGELHADVKKGESLLDSLTRRTQESIHGAIERGADGVFYLLDGAHPAVTTPMEYGGHFLEVDRHLLTEFQDARVNAIFVLGKRDPYLDFVSDLPAHLFGWEADVPLSDVRAMRHGALASSLEGAEVALKLGIAVEAAR